MPVVLHMVCGKIGSGKSTLTRRLAAQPMTVLISEDDWLARLYPNEIHAIADYARCAGRLRAAMTGHIEAHPGDRLTVERLAGLAGLSRAHFVRQFSRLAGMSPADYVFRARMARAARLLQASQFSIAEIAHSLGFADPNYFAKAFRRAFEVSPTEFRQSGLFAGP